MTCTIYVGNFAAQTVEEMTDGIFQTSKILDKVIDISISGS